MARCLPKKDEITANERVYYRRFQAVMKPWQTLKSSNDTIAETRACIMARR